jgi:hypothetical protein
MDIEKEKEIKQFIKERQCLNSRCPINEQGVFCRSNDYLRCKMRKVKVIEKLCPRCATKKVPVYRGLQCRSCPFYLYYNRWRDE